MPRPNVLWIQTDEHRPDSLRCYGSEWAKTPHIDALANRGVVFRNCLCNSPVCVPSRASQLTGRYPQEINVVHNHVANELNSARCADIYPPSMLTFPEVFAAAGYATASIGKWHTPEHPTWQTNRTLVNLDQYAGYYALNGKYDEAAHKVIKRPGSTPIILAGTYPVADGHPSQVITDWAIEWLRERHKDTPFFLTVSHNWPHTPVLPPPPYDSAYTPDEISIRYYDHAAYLTRAQHDRRIADAHRMRELTRPQIQQVWKDYMGLVTCIDAQVGRLVSALRDLSLVDNTIILFSADHGKALGEWGATEKGFFDSEVWRVPFILAGPGVPVASQPDWRICELIDTGPTLFTLAGLHRPAQFTGRDLLNESPRDAVFSQIGWPDHAAPLFQRVLPTQSKASMRVAVRTQRYRLDATWYRQGLRVSQDDADGNLFDLEADPLETTNFWNDHQRRMIRNELWDRLVQWDRMIDHPALLFSDSRSATWSNAQLRPM